MKIRSGFVSNSSSSSFIVRFPKDPTNIDNLREMMGDCHPTCGYYTPSLTSEEVINHVHRDLGGHMGNSFESFYDDKRYDWETEDSAETRYRSNPQIALAYDGRDWYDLETEEKDALIKMWLYEEYNMKYGNQNGVFIYEFTYSDECGPVGTQMEHGDIFRNLEHTSKSHH
ncbi:hypothetical protein Lw1_gp116 [Escherichia phage Lw1]|uniref:Uncharacterized protein n=1 Tax=Escherichia phage Lw1 TaxID=1307804 RepID=M9V167_9CAUD|nr:hypothetical protein Lw1_gp116 [Escherichia phage Lw1]AGJ71524.1 hypothetical protein Lw1_gp116 [Escherichia phage Lw1]